MVLEAARAPPIANNVASFVMQLSLGSMYVILFLHACRLEDLVDVLDAMGRDDLFPKGTKRAVPRLVPTAVSWLGDWRLRAHTLSQVTKGLSRTCMVIRNKEQRKRSVRYAFLQSSIQFAQTDCRCCSHRCRHYHCYCHSHFSFLVLSFVVCRCRSIQSACPVCKPSVPCALVFRSLSMLV